MVYLGALLPLTHGVAAYAALKKAADTTVDDRSHSQVMADTLVERLTGQPADIPTPVDVGVVIGDKTLLGLDDEPAEIPDYGPIPADIARHLIADAADDPRSHAALRNLYCHPTSRALVAMHSRSRAFPPGLVKFIRYRDGTCRTPYCNAPISQIDHATPHAAGGPTTAHNGNGRCAQCNYDKEAPGWTTQTSTDPDGTHTITITTPTGQKYQSKAPPQPGSAAA